MTQRQSRQLGRDSCIRKGFSDAFVKLLSEEQTLTLQVINSLRYADQRHLVDVSEQHLYIQVQAGLTLFRGLFANAFGSNLALELRERALQLSTTPPVGLATLFDSEVKEVERQLKKSGPTLARYVSDTQSNLVIVQAESSLWMDDNTMSDVLYGNEGITLAKTADGERVQRSHRAPGGLFDGRRFSRICGVVLVPQNITPIDDTFTGDYFPNPMHLHHIQQHPKPFDEVMFNLPRVWIDGNALEPMAHKDGSGVTTG